ncbi:MAG TPA: PLP-dependent transferase, partial [Candidatus Krumholzibacteria bacterium]
AMEFARRIADLGLPVLYPGLPTHPDHELFSKICNPGYGFGGIFGVDLGSVERANRFMETLQNEKRFGFMAVSLGFFDTLMSCSSTSTSSELTEEERVAAHILPGLVRISIGYTGTLEGRWRQFEEALLELGVIESHSTR